MAGRFRWRTPPPTAVDERLTVAADGTADLLVLAPRSDPSAIGWFRASVPAPEAALLAAADDIDIDPRVLPPPDLADLVAAAEGAAAAARATPVAVVRFTAVVASGPALAAFASGTQALAFELDVAASAVVFEDATGQALAWHPLPDLATGFMSADAEGLGGVRRAAEVRPGSFGAIALPLPVLAGATSLRIDVVGWLPAAPHEVTPMRFHARTDAAPVRSGAA